MIFIKHPKLEGDHAPTPVSEEAFRKVWQRRGWVAVSDKGEELEVDDNGMPVTPEPETPTDPPEPIPPRPIDPPPAPDAGDAVLSLEHQEQ